MAGACCCSSALPYCTKKWKEVAKDLFFFNSTVHTIKNDDDDEDEDEDEDEEEDEDEHEHEDNDFWA